MKQRGARPPTETAESSRSRVARDRDRPSSLETENVLLGEREAQAHARAMSDVLGVISRSPNDLQPVLDAIVVAALRLCDAVDYAMVSRSIPAVMVHVSVGTRRA